MSIYNILKNRILVLDGAMGTMIQRYNLTEKDYRGSRFADYPLPLKGNNDLLVLTQSIIIYDIHCEYLKAGADIIETNSFNAQAVSLADYNMENLAYEINLNAAKIAKLACENFSSRTKPRFVAGSIGPTNKSLFLPSDLNNPEKRSISFEQMTKAFKEQINGLIDGGVDLLLVETIFDTLNAKSCLFAISQIFTEKNITLPVMISVTISDNTGRTLSGQTLEAFVNSISHFPYLSIGLNCALGAEQIKPYLQKISKLSNAYVSVYPNAGLPDQSGNYKETAEEMTEIVKSFVDENLVNIIGGCCGTTPEHIKLFSEVANHGSPKKQEKTSNQLILSGTESLEINQSNFFNIGERTNVAGSRRFARLIREKKYDEALIIARKQIESGASIIDISFDDGLLDAKQEMETFLRLIACEPDIAKVPLMIDSSNFDVIEIGLKNSQGKSIVNSISLKNGEEEFKKFAKIIKNYGAAIVVMAFDENGQASDYQSKINICKRAYDILVNDIDFPAQDIIFDCNILTIGTGITEHSDFAIDFINAVKWVKQNLPLAKTSGGISNLSFAFRGNDTIREALHSTFIHYARNVGLDMAIVNPSNLPNYNQIEPQLKSLCEDLIFNKHKNATENLSLYNSNKEEKSGNNQDTDKKRKDFSVESRIKSTLINGIADFIEEDIKDALEKYQNPVDIIEKPLMDAMNEIGVLFGNGKMFLPQVMKSARIMKKMTDIIQPAIDKQNNGTVKKAGKILLATVKGDVHDIGKNIASIVLSSNNFEIIDLGIMVEKEKIIDEAIANNVDIIGLSGLISPSLSEMENIAKELEQRDLNIPLILSGATTSRTHTAVKIAPLYSGLVVHVKDVSKAVGICSAIMNSQTKDAFYKDTKAEQQKIENDYYKAIEKSKKLSIEDARKNRYMWNENEAEIIKPKYFNRIIDESASITELLPFINWTAFFNKWKIKGKYPDIFKHPDKGIEAQKLYNDALKMLEEIENKKLLQIKSRHIILPANSIDETVVCIIDKDVFAFDFPRNLLKNNEDGKNLCLADYIATFESDIDDYIGVFALTAGLGIESSENEYLTQADNYNAILLNTLADSLAEAYSEYLHNKVRTKTWGYSNEKIENINDVITSKIRGIKPAPGYAVCPDHSQKEIIFGILKAEELGLKLSENYSIIPSASLCGFYFAHPQIKYFNINE